MKKRTLLSLLAMVTGLCICAQVYGNFISHGYSRVLESDTGYLPDPIIPSVPETSIVPVEGNLLQNSSFEEWMEDGSPSHWSTTSTAGNATLVQSEERHNGNYSVCIIGSSSNKRIGHEEILLNAGTYQLTFFAKATTSDGAAVRPGYVPINENGSVGIYAYGDTYTVNDSEWIEINHEFTLETEQQVALIIMNSKTPGNDVLIDDASLILLAGNMPEVPDTTYIPVEPEDSVIVPEIPSDSILLPIEAGKYYMIRNLKADGLYLNAQNADDALHLNAPEQSGTVNARDAAFYWQAEAYDGSSFALINFQTREYVSGITGSVSDGTYYLGDSPLGLTFSPQEAYEGSYNIGFGGYWWNCYSRTGNTVGTWVDLGDIGNCWEIIELSTEEVEALRESVGPMQILNEALTQYGQINPEDLVAGINPGNYPQEAIALYAHARQAVIDALNNGDAANVDELAENLMNARNDLDLSLVQVQAGEYYMIQNLRDGDFLYEGGDNQVLFAQPADANLISAEDAAFYFFIDTDSLGSNYVMKNYLTNAYVGKFDFDGFNAVSSSSSPYGMEIFPQNGGSAQDVFNIRLTEEGVRYGGYLHQANDNSLVTWEAPTTDPNLFRFITISQESIDGLAGEVDQIRLNTAMQELLNRANSLYTNSRSFIPSGEVTPDADMSAMGLVTDVSQLSTNAQEESEGPIAGLIDNDFSTYFHSTWQGGLPDEPWIDADLGTYVDALSIKLTRRITGNSSAAPKKFNIYGSNDTITWTSEGIANISYEYDYVNEETWETYEDLVGVTAFRMSQPYRYIRLGVPRENTLGGDPWFHLSELRYFSGATYDSNSPYEQASEETRAAFETAMAAAEAELEAGNATVKTQTMLQNAYYALYEQIENSIPSEPEDSIFNGDKDALYQALESLISEANELCWNTEMSYTVRNSFDPVINTAQEALWSDDYNNMLSSYQALQTSKAEVEEHVGIWTNMEAAYSRMYNAYSQNSSVAYHAAIYAYNTACNNYENKHDLSNTALLALTSEMNRATNMLTGVIEDPSLSAPKDTVVVHIDEPGTLGEKILMQAEYLSDSIFLVVSGSLNDADVATIKESMTNLVGIDMSALNMATIPDEMFYDRDVLQEVILPNNLETIGQYAFYDCNNLRSISLPASTKTIGQRAFYGCQIIKTLTLNDGLESIGNYAFTNLRLVKDITLPSTLKSIGSFAFNNCIALNKIVIPEGVTSMGYSCFENCDSLKKVTLPSTLTEVPNNAFRFCDNLTTVVFAEGLKTIGSNAFYYCRALCDISLPTSLTSLNAGAFGYCQLLTDVTIPAGVSNCSSVFSSCNNLRTITSLAIVPPYNEDGRISDYDGAITLYVPSLSLVNYKLNESWNQFKEILPIDVMPETINVYSDFRFLMPDSLPADYKPTINLVRNPQNENQYGSLTVVGNGNTTLSVDLFTLNYDINKPVNDSWNWQNENAYCNSLVSRSNMRADSVVTYLFMPSARWEFLTFPYDVKISDITAFLENTQWVIRKYSGAARANGALDSTWVDVPADGTLKAGEGYIWQAVNSVYDYYSGFTIPALNNENKNKIFAMDDCEVALTEYPSEFSHNRSWNLIGNPYPCFYDSRFMDFEAPITVWNSSNNTYEAYSLVDDSRILDPGEAFFVQCPVGAESVLFTTEGRQTNRAVRTAAAYSPKLRSITASREVFNFFVSDGKNTDKTRVVLNPQAEVAYNAATDASKFMSSDKSVAQIYTIEDGVDMSINERPYADGVTKLGAYFGAAGTYTITLDTESGRLVTLIDKLNGNSAVLNQGAYEFTAEAGVANERFELLFDAAGGSVTGINTADVDVEVKAKGGQIEVKASSASDIIVYTLDGRTIAAVKAANAAFSVEEGVYIVKVNGKVYKLTVNK